ncbi:MAG: phospho-N-acetylmuramoyl-pentapeptide-transferase [Paludibacteraceae bacterium]|nr:phospho-N-acetylmuramoyl-pentapeptide-transferase [Paludibacteraceae bacterium]
MLYHLFDYLTTAYGHWAGARLMTYISFRAIVAAVIALLTAMWFGKHFIALLKSKNISETQRDEKLDPFNTKKVGVPTMGGIVIIVAILIAALLMGKLSNVYMLLMIITTLILGLLGFLDDYIKTFRKNKDGLNGWAKIAGQVALGLIVGLTLRYSPQAVMNETVEMRPVTVVSTDDNAATQENEATYLYKSPTVKSTRTTIPFVKDHNANYADLFSFLGETWKYKVGWIFFVLLIVFVVAAFSNGANLNDGMDGMCAGNSAIIGIALIVLAYVSGSTVWADYFDVMYIPGSEELVVFLGAFVGALIGFLWYNSYPAQIFMGDTGSLTIGGIIAVSACIMHKELLVPILCGVFLMESVSVIVQTQVYKWGKRSGKHIRIWKRTPLHDHFRTSVEQVLKNDPTCIIRFKGSNDLHHENKITIRFVLVTILLAAFTILTLKIR